MLEIVEGEAIEHCVCAWADGSLTRPCKCQVLVNMGLIGGIKAKVDTLPMPSVRPRLECRFVLWNCGIKMLAEGVQSARLETRTKESNMYASRWVINP